jgi:preprotein translocase subunit Sec61beta
MKRIFLPALFLLLLAGSAFADGMVMRPPDYSKEVFIPEQKAVIFWDGSTEKLILESKISVEDIANVAWVVPIQSSTKPVVETADEQIFFRLADLFRPPRKASGGIGILGVSGAQEEGGVEVVEQLKLDIYDITILRATDETALIDWLNANGYSFPTAFPGLVRDYIYSGSMYFIANKINLQNKYPGMSTTNEDFECAQELTKGPYYSRSYWGRGDIGQDEIAYRMKIPQCENASPAAVAALVQLRLGIATPLEITFTPGRPFYPMKISSFNPGAGDARVYFIGKKAFSDSSGLFTLSNMVQVQNSSLSEYGINSSDTVTLLQWKGNYYSLDKDSFFNETEFNPALDPKYVPLEQIIAGWLFVILIALLVAAIFLAIPFIAIPFAIGIVVHWVLAQRKSRKSIFGENKVLAMITAALLALAGPVAFYALLVLPVLLSSLFYSGGAPYFLEMLFPSLIFFIISLLIFAPYFASMACGFFFRKSGYNKRWLLGAAIVFAILVLAAILPFIGLPVYY